MTKRTACILALIIAIPMVSGLAGDAGLALLKNEHAARPAGMGGVGVTTASDPNAIAVNPAAAAGLDKFAASFGHTIFWENIRFESGFFGGLLFPRVYFLGGARFANVDDIELRSIASTEPEGYFENQDISAKFGLAYQINDEVDVGLAAGFIFEKIEAWRGSSFNVDLGAQADLRPDVRVGAAITNLGGDLTLTKAGDVDSDPIPLPTTYRLGGSYQYRMVQGGADLVVVDSDAHLHLGAEGEIKEYFKLRAGFMTGYDSKGFTAGAAFSMRNVTVDYAFLPFTNNLGTSHLFNVTFSL